MLLQHTGFNDALNVCRSLLQYGLNIAYIHVERIRVKPVLHLFLFSVVSLLAMWNDSYKCQYLHL